MWRLLPCYLLAPALLWAQAPLPPDLLAPADVVQLAAQDLARVPFEGQRTTRYISLAPVPPAERGKWADVLSGHLNGLSREVDLVRPALVGPLLRIDLRDYGIDPRVWDRLPDPYFTVRIRRTVVTLWPGGVWRDGQSYAAGSFTWKREEVTAATAPWLAETIASAAAVSGLVTATGSQVPVVHGPWLLWQTAVQEGRSPGYYDLLGVKDQKGFEALIRFDPKAAAQLEQRRALVFSEITQQPRRVERTATVLGGLWRTGDSAEAIDRKNPLRVLDDDFRFDVTEQFAPLPNGLMASYLGNAQGVRQDKAPDNIIQGDHTGGRDKRLHVNLSCIRCHAGLGKAESFVKGIDAAPLRKLASYDREKYRELNRQYGRGLETLIEQDRRGYAAALKAATGMAPQEYALAYGRYYAAHDDLKADAAHVGRDWGLTTAQVTTALKAYDSPEGRLDAVASIILSGGRISRSSYEEAQPLLYQVFQGVRR